MKKKRVIFFYFGSKGSKVVFVCIVFWLTASILRRVDYTEDFKGCRWCDK